MAADMNVLVLHSRLSGYWMACMRACVQEYGATFFVVKKKASGNAPFDFENEKGIYLYDFSSFSDGELVNFCKDKNPNFVYVSGWAEQNYLDIARHYYKKGTPVICGLDNHWTGSLRQQAGKLYLKYLSPKTFTHVWISGLYQFEYARRLGFNKERILTGVYSADVEAFSKARKKSKEKKYPKSFLYVGRFIERKGLMELAQAFERIQHTTALDWSLTLIGTGPLEEELQKFDNIKILDFVQPKELPEVISNYGVFILPSLDEPWGVVVHEAASVGMPIICTHDCGAATAFVRNGYNGYLVESGSVESLQMALQKVIKLNDSELDKMGNRSYELSRQITPKIWASTLHEIVMNDV